MEASSLTYREKLNNQIQEAYGKVTYTYTTHIIQAARIKSMDIRIKWTELILSAISAGGFLLTIITNQAVLAWIGGLCSTALLVLTSCVKELEHAEKQKAHLTTSNQLWSVREDYISLLVDFENLTDDEIAIKRDQLKDRTRKIYEHAPVTDAKSYSLAQLSKYSLFSVFSNL